MGRAASTRLTVALATAAAAAGAGVAGEAAPQARTPAGDRPAASRHKPPRRLVLANHCFTLRSVASARFVAAAGAGAYRAASKRLRGAGRFYLKPTDLGAYMLYDRGGRLMAAGSSGKVDRTGTPGPPAEWRPLRQGTRSFAIRSTAQGRDLAVGRNGALTLVAAGSGGRTGRFTFLRARGCRSFPEAAVGARGRTFKGTRRDGTVFGFADMHLHITADMRAGGNVIYGEAYDRFGISEALGHDDRAHGPDGRLDVTGNLLRHGSPTTSG
jgi:hypothetical protein